MPQKKTRIHKKATTKIEYRATSGESTDRERSPDKFPPELAKRILEAEEYAKGIPSFDELQFDLLLLKVEFQVTIVIEDNYTFVCATNNFSYAIKQSN